MTMIHKHVVAAASPRLFAALQVATGQWRLDADMVYVADVAALGKLAQNRMPSVVVVEGYSGDDRHSVIARVKATLPAARIILLTDVVSTESFARAKQEGVAEVLAASQLSLLGPVVLRELDRLGQRDEYRYRHALSDDGDSLRQVLEQMDQMLFVRSADNGQLLFINRAFESFTGRSVEEAYGNPDIFQAHIHPGDMDRMEAMVSSPEHQAGDMTEIEFRCVHLSGPTRWVRGTTFALRDTQGKITRRCGIVEDVTERKLHEESLKKALAQEKELNELKLRFIGTASHEFRTPLATILAAAETLIHYRNRLDDAKVGDRLESIKKQVFWLKSIIEDMLTMTAMESDKLTFDAECGDLNALCQSIVDEFDAVPENRGRIRYRASGQIEMAMDARLMRKLVCNPLANALKYSSSAPVCLSLQREGDHVTVHIQDSGVGISESDMAHLYEPFHRAVNVSTIPGTGLGLSITKVAVERHGGAIDVQSQLGAGTKVTISLPVCAC